VLVRIEIELDLLLLLPPSILLLNTGVGLCGVLASQYADTCVITDGEEEVFGLLKENVEKNCGALFRFRTHLH
jgi:hypothetical protein